MKYIAFVCGHNTGRSQMAQALFNTLKSQFPNVDAEYEAISCGTGIGTQINERVATSLREINIDISDTTQYYPKDVQSSFIQERVPDIVRAYTMGCMDATCPDIGGVPITGDWALDDPAKPETDVTAVRQSLTEKVTTLLTELNTHTH